MNVIVTGGAGFIGTHVVDLLERERNIYVISADKAEKDRQDKNIHTIKADLTNLDELKEILLNYDISMIVHLVGLPHIGDCEKNPHLSFYLNTLCTQNIVEAVRKADVQKILFASTGAIYGYNAKKSANENNAPNPNTIYGLHKLMSEQIIRSYQEKYGIKNVIFRLFNVYGIDPIYGRDIISIFIRRLQKNQPLIIVGPNKYRDFVYVEDVAQAFLKACITNVSNVTVNIGSGTRTTLRQLAEFIKEIFPKTKIIEKPSPDDGTGLYADITLARTLLSFDSTSVNEGIQRHFRKYVKNSRMHT